ncbi:hypothetical protein [Streptomyces sp. NBC_01190]|uniref:hypothetical protein n=1 Tax=Streptomyces sp. NBC_01190 TaxID=2903767 RepID=UPI00386C9C07|nr:hypothetical protein OG519_05250 [Streptomyces sp. NBC_01190]
MDSGTPPGALADARGFVSVERYEVTRARKHPPGGGCGLDGRVPALSLAVGTTAGQVVLRATPGAAEPGGRQVLDEHFVVDADAHDSGARLDRAWLDCADVLYGSRPRSPGDAIRWLTGIAAGRDTCRMAAVPLTKNGWAALDTARQEVTLLPVDTPHGHWLWPSCLLGWLTAGGKLQDLVAVRPAYSPGTRGG